MLKKRRAFSRSKFIVKGQTYGEYMFNLLTGNGQVILTSEGYQTKEDCMNGIVSAQANSHLHARYERRQSSDGQHYFVREASNGKIIATSELYHTQQSLMIGIKSVMGNGRTGVVVDQFEDRRLA